jgi:hypothetical protein
MAASTAGHADLDVDVVMEPAGPVVVGTPARVEVRARSTSTALMTVDETRFALVRTARYGYRNGNLYGTLYTAWEKTTTTVAQARETLTAHLGRGEQIAAHAALTVPDNASASAAGTLIQIHWAVQVRLVRPGRRDVVVEQPLEVRSAAGHCASDAAAPAEEHALGYAVMTFDRLSSRTVVPGRPVTGLLRLAALQPVPARRVRFELVLQERVEHGPGAGPDPARSPAHDDKETETVLTSMVFDLDGIVEGSSREDLFTVPVPESLPAPSLRCAQFRIRWVLRAVLDLRFRPDPSLTVPLHAPAMTAVSTPGH